MSAEPAQALPAGVEAYRRTDIFTEATLPAALRRAHSTKADAWGLIHVIEGELRYRILDERRAAREYRLAAGGAPGVVEPTIEHEVEPIGEVRMQVEFFR